MSLRTILERIQIYYTFYFKAKTIYRLHSPFFYAFVRFVFDSTNNYYAFRKLESWQRDLASNENLILSTEFSHSRNQDNSSIKNFHTRASSPLVRVEELFRLALFSNAQQMLELGSCLGMSSIAMQLTNSKAKVIAVEGNTQFCTLIHSMCKKYEIPLPSLINTDFNSFLNQDQGSYDLIFLDGDHQYDKTLEYVKLLINKINAKGIIILDDIHWSKDMFKAWNEIKTYPEVRCSLETLRWGILFFDPALNQEHISYIDYKYKPWQIGLFA